MTDTAALSTGTVTFLFTDIEGSTRLWEEQPEAMHRDLSLHDALLRAAIERHSGQVFKTVGDAFYAAFPTPQDAAEAALDAQRGLLRELPQVRVRMAVHTGRAEARDGDYFGPALNHVSRLLAAGHGGQVLLSQPTADQVRPALTGDTTLRLLGHHRLRDIAASETIFQLAPPDLPWKFPPLNTLDVAFRRGVMRTSAIAAVVLLIMLGLTGWAVANGRRAERNEALAKVQRRIAENNARRADENAAEKQKEARRADKNAAQANTQKGRADQKAAEAAREARVADARRRDAVEARGRADEQQQIAVAARDEALRQKQAAESQRETNRMRLVRLNLDNGRRLMDEGDLFGALPYLTEAHRLDREKSLPDHVHRVRLAAVLRQCPKLVHLWFLKSGVDSAEFSRDGRRVLTTSFDGAAQVWDAATGALVGKPFRGPSRSRGGDAPLASSAALSPDGQRIVAISDERAAQVWDIATGQPVGKPFRHAGAVRAVSFSPDSRHVLTASEDGTARVWDVSTGEPGPPLQHKGKAWISGAFFSPDGRLVLVRSDGVLHLFDAATGTERLSTPSVGASRSPFSPDGRFVVTTRSGPDERRATVWDTATGRAVGSSPPRSHKHGLTTAALSPDGQRVVTGSYDTTARIWDVATGNAACPPLRHGGSVLSAAFSPDGRWIATAGDDHAARVWDATTGEMVSPPLPHNGRVFLASFATDGRRLLTASDDGTVRIWEMATDENVVSPLQTGGCLRDVAFSSDGKRLATANDDGRCRVWDVATGESITPELQNPVAMRVVFSPDNRRLLTSGVGGARVWDVATGKPLTPPLTPKGLMIWRYHSISSFSSDGRRVLTVDRDGRAQAWDANNGAAIGRPLNPSGAGAAFSPDGSQIFTVGNDGTVGTWNARTSEPVMSPRHIGAPVALAVFSPDSRRFATIRGYDARLVQVWETAAGKVVTPPLLHGGAINFVSFSPDGRRLVTASADSTARVWDATTGKLLLHPLQHSGFVWRACFSPDGRSVVTTSADRTARVWDAATGEPVTPPLWHDGTVHTAAVSPDGRRIATGSMADPSLVRLWGLPADNRDVRDLVRLTGLLSGRQIDATAGTVALNGLALQSAWQTLRAKYPADFCVSREQTIQWHRRQAEECVQSQQWSAALFHLDQLLALASSNGNDDLTRGRALVGLNRRDAALAALAQADEHGQNDTQLWQGCADLYAGMHLWEKAVVDYSRAIDTDASQPQLYFSRAHSYAELNRWEEAGSDFTRLIEMGVDWPLAYSMGVDWPLAYYYLGLAQLGAGDTNGYRRTYASFVERLGNRADRPGSSVLPASLAALIPNVDTDAARPLQFAEEALVGARFPLNYQRDCALQGVLYRAGRFEEAAQQLTDGLQPGGGDALHALWLAMCHARLGHAAEARQWLEKGNERLVHTQQRKPEENPLAWQPDWDERLILQRLRQEAETLIPPTRP